MRDVLPIEQVTKRLVGKAGQKCVHLGDLLSAGFQVPRGFCILSSGYERFVAANGLEQRIQAFLERVTPRSKPLEQRAENELLEVFLSSRFPPGLEQEILRSYRALSPNGKKSPSVAVRSSGALEDGDHASFAGQFESFLNVRGDASLLEQIKRCWASFWNTRSLCYQMDRHLSNGAAGIAILVQEMIPARLSGVLFSANPISGSSRQMVIEASWGLGEAVVGGTVKPDRYVVDFETSRVLEQTIQNKEVMVDLDRGRGGATLHRPVPAAKQRIPCLTEREIELLVKTGKRVHQHCGGPQDIEWAFHGKDLYLLQARPITTLCVRQQAVSQACPSLQTSWGSEFDTFTSGQTEWMSTAIRDMLPGALSPLTISQMSALEYGFKKPQEQLGLLRAPELSPDRNFLGFFYNRAHLNMSLIHAMIHQVPLMSSENLERLLEEEPGPAGKKPWFSLRFARDVPKLLRVGLHALEMARRLEPAAETLLAEGLKLYAEECGRDLASPSPEALVHWLDEIQKRRAEIYAMHITASEFGEVTFQLFKRFTRRLAADVDGKQTLQLITGSSTPLFAKPIVDLWALAQQITANASLQQRFLSASSQTIWRQLASEKGRPAKAFREAFQSFLRQYGYRSRYGAELMHPPWEEEPVFILSMVRVYSKLLLTLNPWEMERAQARRRFETLRILGSNLNPVSKKILRELLKLMDILVPMRQNMRALSLMQAHLSRQAAQELARRLVGAGVLAAAPDIYFLTMEELHEAVQAVAGHKTASTGFAADLRRRIVRRRAEFQKNLHVILPESFRGKPEPLRQPRCPPLDHTERRIRGLPVSPGRVTGPARRITAPVQEIRVQPGEILILPGMDPGWTPLFPAASAIVTDRGGILSHGSILARAYGIPAVTGISDITRIIQTGRVITVDGDRGEVWL